MGANKKYKASVFSLLFSDPDLLRELYGALEGISLPADIPITINTLQDVLFKDRINDISFAIGDKLVVPVLNFLCCTTVSARILTGNC